MGAFGVGGVDVGADHVVAPGGTPAARVRRRARRLVGELPAGDGGRRRRHRDRSPGCGRARCRATSSRRPARGDGLHRGRRAALVTVSATGRPLRGIDVDLADVSDLVPTLAAVPRPRRRRRRSPASGSSAARRATASAISPPSCAHRRRRRRDRRRPAHRAVGAAPPRRVARHAPRPPAGDGVRRPRAAVDGIGVDDPSVVGKSWPDFWDAYDALLAGQ